MTHHPVSCRKARREQFQRLTLETLEDRTLLSPVSWIGPNGGDWDNKVNWSTGLVPTRSDDVTINSPGITINHAANSTDAVNSLTIQSSTTIALSAGSLTIDSGGMTMTNGLVDVRAGGTLDISSGATVLAEEGSSGGQFGITIEALGTMNATGVSFTHTGSTGLSQLQVNAGATFTATGCTFQWSGMTLANILSPTDVTGNTFNQNIAIAAINADELTDNTGFQYVYILGGTLTSTQRATLAPLANDQIYVLAGAELTVAAGATLNVDGATVVAEDLYDANTPGIFVDGTMTATGASFTNNSGSNSSILQIDADGTFSATGSTFSWTTMSLYETLTPTQVTGNTFAGTTTFSIAAIDADKIGNNSGLQQVYILNSTLASGQSVTFAPLALGQVYVITLGLEVSAGATLNVNGATVVGQDGFGTSPSITVDGVMNLDGASFTNAAGSAASAIQVNADGTLNATGSNLAWANLTLLEILSSTNVTGNTIGPATTVSIIALDADKLTGNSGFHQVNIVFSTLTNGQTATLVPLGAGQIYVFSLGLAVGAGATLNVNGANVVAQDGFGSSPTITVDGIMNVNGASLTNAAGSGTSAIQVNADGTLNVSGTSLMLWTTLNNAGQITVPAGPVPLQNFTQTSTGTLNVQVASSSASGEYSQLTMGSATYAGTITVRVTNHFVPNDGDKYTVIKAVSETGSFSSLLPDSWTAAYPNNTVVLTAEVYPLTDTTPSGTTLTATEGIPATGLVVATFSEATPNGQVSDFEVPTINWGDGVTSNGTISLISRNSTVTNFEVTGGTTYPDVGSFAVTVVIDALDGASLTSSGNVTVNVADAPLTNTTPPTTLNATEGSSTGTQTVATFSSADPGASVIDFSAAINWGDQTTSTGSVQLVGRTSTAANFEVLASHLYVEAGTYTLMVTMHDVGGQSTSSDNTKVLVADAPLTDTTVPAAPGATEGSATGIQVVATFSDGNPYGQTSDFSAVINWGDQMTSTGSVALVNRTGTAADFEVTGDHTYTEAGNYPVTVTVHDVGDSTLSSNRITFAVADAPLTNTTVPLTFNAIEGSGIGSQVVATFTDGNPDGHVSDFSNTVINWGDQTTSTGTVQLLIRTGTEANFEVTGNHTYAQPGSYTVTVSINDVGGASVTATQTTVAVADAALTDTTTAQTFYGYEGINPGSRTVATFASADPLAPVSDFANTVVNWGDQTTSTGTVEFVSRTNTAANFQVVGSHAYADEGAYTVTVNVHDVGGSSTSTDKVTFSIADAPLTDTTPAATLNAIAGINTGNQVLATFADANPGAPVTDFGSPLIYWGDQTTSTGTVQLVNRTGTAANFEVLGSHTYTGAGQFPVDVVVHDVGGASVNTTATKFSVSLMLPVVSGISPAVGPSGGGTVVTITGNNLANALVIDFGNTPATIKSNTNTQIVATSPAGNAGTLDITVTSSTGTSLASAADRFTYVASPVVGGISPQAGPLGGGTSVTITGSNLANATAVDFGGVAAVIKSDTATQIVATSPRASPGSADVTVTTIGGTSATSAADLFTYVAAPIVTGVSPASGPSTGGATVTITGSGLTNAAAVDFGSAAAEIISDSATQIVVSSPAGNGGAVDLTVTTVGGTSAHSANDRYTYIVAPNVHVTPPASDAASIGFPAPLNLGSFTDTVAGPWTVSVNWGDGSAPTSFVVSTPGALPAQTHAFATAGSYDATVTVTDPEGSTNSGSFAVIATGMPAQSVVAIPAAGGDDLFTISVNRGLYFHASGAGWQQIGGAGTIESISGVRDSSGNPVLFVLTTSAELFRYSPAAGWAQIGGSGTIRAISAGTDVNGQANVFVLTSDNSFFEYSQAGWAQIGGANTILSMAAASQGRVVVITADHSVFEFAPNMGWVRLTGAGFASALSVTTDASSNLVIFAVTVNNALYQEQLTTGWQALGAAGTIQSISAGTDASGQADVYALNAGGALLRYNRGKGWVQLGAPHSVLAMAAASGDQVYAVTASDALYGEDDMFGWYALSGSGFVEA